MSTLTPISVDHEVCPILHGRYRLLRQIGEGTMGKVFLAEDLKLAGKKWAIKQVDGEKRDILLAEVDLLSRLDHPHLPRIVDLCFSSDETKAYIVMDFIEGESLQTRFARSGKVISTSQALRIAAQICELFTYLHEHQPSPVIYRDLKPDHIILDRHDHVTIVDFGIARQFKHGQLRDTIACATIGFASPEQLAGKQTDARADLYSLGALLYYLLTEGCYASLDDDLQRLRKRVKPDIANFIATLLHAKPENRYATAHLVGQRIAELLATEQQPVRVSENKKSLTAIARVIACRGLESVSGCTHGAMMMAHALARSGYKVAFLELCNYPCLAQFFSSSISRDKVLANHIEHTGVDYFLYCDELKVQSHLFAGYDFIVLDLGSESSEWAIDEFERADIPLFISFAGLLGHQKLQQFLSVNEIPAHRWRFMLMAIDDERESVMQLDGIVQQQMVCLPAVSNPERASASVDGQLMSMVEPILNMNVRKFVTNRTMMTRFITKLRSLFA